MLTGTRGEIHFVEMDDHLRGFVVRPAYHPDENPADDPWLLHIFMGVGLVVVAVAIIGLIAHALLPTIH